MKFSKRYSTLELPSYAHVPGKTTHPNKPGGHQYQKEGPTCQPINPQKALEHQIFCYGVDLLNRGYFWESHVAFEAAWNAHHRKGEIADLLKALIKMAAAGLKAKLQQTQAAQGHLLRARELLNPLAQNHPLFCSLKLNDVYELTFLLEKENLDHFFDHLKLTLCDRSD